MFTKRNALLMGMLFLLLVASACGPAATEEPRNEPAAPYSPAATEEPAYSGDSYTLESDRLSSPSESPSQDWGEPPKRQPTDTFFEDYGVNPFIDTEDDHLSTFALDVDTGSYTIMRNYLKDGLTVPPDSVRVEEYINYFDQNYPNPSAHQAFTISMDGAPSPFTQTERYQMLRIGVQGYQVPEDERKDASLTFVIDVSGSMDMDNRLGLVKRSLELLVEQLGRRDNVSIVVYGSSARVILDPTSGADKDAILSAIYSLRPEGATNAEAGIRLGYRMALQAYNPNGINRVILCSDGVANVGNTEAEVILDEIHSHVKEGVTMTTIGFGMDNYNDVLMEQLADNGDGFYAYVDDMREAKRLFIDNLTGSRTVLLPMMISGTILSMRARSAQAILLQRCMKSSCIPMRVEILLQSSCAGRILIHDRWLSCQRIFVSEIWKETLIAQIHTSSGQLSLPNLPRYSRKVIGLKAALSEMCTMKLFASVTSLDGMKICLNYWN